LWDVKKASANDATSKQARRQEGRELQELRNNPD